MRLIVFIMSLVFMASLSWAEAAVKENKAFVLCKNNNIVRTIRVSENNDGCETVYTKAGVDRVVGSGRHTQSCLQFQNNIKNNLEEAAWTCREVAKSKVTIISDSSTEE